MKKKENRITNAMLTGLNVRLPMFGTKEFDETCDRIAAKLGRKLTKADIAILRQAAHVQHGDALRHGKLNSQRLSYRNPPGHGGRLARWAKIKPEL